MSLSLDFAHDFGAFRADLQVEAPAGITALFGPSGAGKSTAIAALAGHLRPDRGRIVLNDRVLLDTAQGIDLPPQARRIGLVFQDARLFPHLSVRANLRYGLRFAPPDAPGAGFDEVVDLLGIGALMDRRPSALSGGERQRVAIGRALIARPAALALDEPLAALDPPRRAAILPFLERLRDRARLPILFISHAPDEVARLAQTLVLIEAGRAIATGPVAEVMATPEAARLMGARDAGAVLAATIIAQTDGLTRLATPAGPMALPPVAGAAGARLRLVIHAQDVILSRARPEGLSALNILPATVTALTPEGEGAMLVSLRAGQAALIARVTRHSAQALDLQPGGQVHAILKAVAVAAPV